MQTRAMKMDGKESHVEFVS